ncbi:hypothetical protein NEOLEDRAFT_496058 [Neolentinus lepideus HHB14362 ss-1]|uniref:Uncharacterized protein n=1 Tax=Neolentinus lepideus HHB14362 ss-1 TaxID=1314782 RepID=A0A165RN25_9AGAM|nr:hypothetical protein NEOLEDRAFT_496058 [Neolentinus lepideus HHB14362 ss-1]
MLSCSRQLHRHSNVRKSSSCSCSNHRSGSTGPDRRSSRPPPISSSHLVWSIATNYRRYNSATSCGWTWQSAGNVSADRPRCVLTLEYAQTFGTVVKLMPLMNLMGNDTAFGPWAVHPILSEIQMKEVPSDIQFARGQYDNYQVHSRFQSSNSVFRHTAKTSSKRMSIFA